MRTSNGVKISAKIILLTAAVFLLAAGCNKIQPPSASQPVSQSAGQQSTSTGQTVPPKISLVRPGGQQGINVYQTVDGSYEMVDGLKVSDVSYAVDSGTNALFLLKSGHKVETKNYSGIGEMVLSIDGIKPDSKHFWAFYVNGKSSNVGASSYVLKDGDKIEWKLEAISSSGE